MCAEQIDDSATQSWLRVQRVFTFFYDAFKSYTAADACGGEPQVMALLLHMRFRMDVLKLNSQKG